MMSAPEIQDVVLQPGRAGGLLDQRPGLGSAVVSTPDT